MTDLVPRRLRLPIPRTRSLRASDVLAVAVGNGVLIVGMWIRHGGLNGLTTPGTLLIAGGQLTALLGTYLALIGLVLMSRSPWLDRLFGLPRLAYWHRWVGFGCVWLLVAHTVLTTAGFAITTGSDALAETWSLLTTYPYVLMATVGLVMLVAVGITSVRIARRRLTYETWYYIHLYAYLGMALGFAHQLVVGTDFLSDPIAEAYWIGLYLVTVAAILVFRVGQPLQLFVRHRLRVARVAVEAPGVVSVYVTGRELDRAGGPGRAVLPVALPGRGRLVASPSVLLVRRAERPVSAPDGEGDRGRHERHPAAPDWHAGLRRGSVRGLHRRPSNATTGPPDRRRDRDHATPRIARGDAGPARRHHPDLSRQPPGRTSCSAMSSRRS